jgi:DNA-binding NarL/FixJ family response regulator
VKRLVVVAEDSLIVEAIAIGLRRSGEFSVVGHVDGRSASAAGIVAASPDVVLVDQSADFDQAELIRQIKAERDNVTVIILTLAPDSATLDPLFDAGAAAAVSKAAQPQALATLIRETLDGRMLHLYKPPRSTPETAVDSLPAEGSLLSTRELQVLKLLASGSTNSEIARTLWVTEQTVKFHLSNIYRKLGVANRTEASRFAHVHGLIGDGKPAAAS